MTPCAKGRSRAFTILELMAAVLILTVIVAISSVGYAGYRDKAAMLVDETNQKVLLAAVKLYAYDTNALPGSLSQLRSRDVERAYAQVTDGKRPYTLLAFLQEQVGLFDIAEAAPLDKYLGGTPQQIKKILTCPLDEKADSGKSYGLPAEVGGQPLSWLLDSRNADVPLITEVAGSEGTALRHEGKKTLVRIFVGGVIKRETLPSEPSHAP